jgi:ATP-dependent protease ClpP protease subunit
MSSKDDNDDTPATVKTIGNEIFFYGEITQESILDFTEYFKKLEIDVLKKAADMYGYTPMIRVHIMSDGGDLFAGIAAMNVLEKSRVKVTTIAQGSCCSSATFMLLGGSERLMGANAHILIHQISTGEFWGNYEEMKDEVKSCGKFMKAIKDIYMKKTKIPQKKFRKMMKKDLYLSSAKALKYKIVHGIA